MEYEGSGGCAADQYCDGDGLCREDGACAQAIDCYRPGNEFAHIMCLGHAVCDEGACGWTCEDPRCVDLAGLDFGACARVLGVGVVDGACVTVSGCAEGRASFFDSQGACEAACAPVAFAEAEVR